jgi:aldehyde:ferredoxin oxidoreductase
VTEQNFFNGELIMSAENNRNGKYEMRILRVNLSNGQIDEEQINHEMVRKYVGGTGLGTKFLYEEVPPGLEWSDPENRMMFFSGPLGGTRVAGSGTFSVVSKGPMTNLAGASQANGFFGAFLRSSGFDGLIIYGAAKNWTRLHIHDGKAELHDAESLVGKDTWETEDTVQRELGKRCSVYSIGPAGEHLVRFACIVGDHGHVAAHNGLGAVMGSKKLKAISVERGRRTLPVADPTRLSEKAKALFEEAKKMDMMLYEWGTPQLFVVIDKVGALPIRNYTTNIFPGNEKFAGQYIRTHFKIKRNPCWACRMAHCHIMEVTEGPYKGFVGEEPEYEGMAAMGPVIGQTDPGAGVMLANTADRLGMDVNESGWLIGWLMECYEKGFLGKTDLDGIEMEWGNVEATLEMLKKIAHRQGCGNRWAEGVKRVAESMGGEVLNFAVYTHKGASPRSHDHRAVWQELIDTCFTNTSTIEVVGGKLQPDVLGLPPLKNPFDPQQVSTMNAGVNGRRQFDDCLGICRFCLYDLQCTVDCLNAVTGWDFNIQEAMDVGRRVTNHLRMFNFRHGLTREMERPSFRYGSAPVDGPAKGISIAPHWETIQHNYYQRMGWDPETGKPLPETLEKMGLGHLVQDLKGLNNP